MKIIIGLGNPGSKYEQTRHNIGFDVVSFYAKSQTPHFSEWRFNKKFNSEIAEGKINKLKIILVKPQTFMNNSGQTIISIAKFYKVKPANIIVIHDDIDLPLEKIRIKKDGSSGGHRGIESITNSLGSAEFVRLKIGVGQKSKDKKIDAAKLVLKKFTKEEEETVALIIKKAAEAVAMILGKGAETAMSNFN